MGPEDPGADVEVRWQAGKHCGLGVAGARYQGCGADVGVLGTGFRAQG